MTNDKVPAANLTGFAARLKTIKGSESARAFARRCGVSQTGMLQYLSGKSEPTRPVLDAIAKVTQVSLDWLLTGEGPTRVPSISEIVAEIQREIGPSNVVLIPFYEEDEARHTAFSNSWIRTALGLDPDYLGLMRVHGDSMVPTIDDGSIVFFDTSETARQLDDGIFIFRLDDITFVKRLQRVAGGQLKIISDNRAYEPYLVPADGLEIVGRPELCISKI